MSINGILYYTIIQGSHNAQSFLDYVDGLLDMMETLSESINPKAYVHWLRLGKQGSWCYLSAHHSCEQNM